MQMQVNAFKNILEYNSMLYKIVKFTFSVAEFTKSILYNCIKVVRLKSDQTNQWPRACTHPYMHA